MFCLVNTGFEAFERIIRQNRDNFGGQNRAIIHAFVGDEVDHDAGMTDLSAPEGFVGAFDGMSSGESPRQGGMQIDDAVLENGIQPARTT
jgi:hypothetical protein